jgi:hypothetical protein
MSVDVTRLDALLVVPCAQGSTRFSCGIRKFPMTNWSLPLVIATVLRELIGDRQ